jgi:PAS domain S-box-containing protein
LAQNYFNTSWFSAIEPKEIAFKRDRRQFDYLFANLKDGFCYNKIIFGYENKPIDFAIIETNDAFKQIIHTERKILGERASMALPIDIAKKVTELLHSSWQIFSTGKSISSEYHSDDLNKYFSILIYSPQKGYFAAIFEDITERKKAEEALKESEARFRSLYQNSLDAILLTIPNGPILSANPAACLMFGMTELELKKAKRQDLTMVDDRVEAAIKRRKQLGKATAELTFKRKDGSTFEGEVSSSLFTDADGTVKTSMIIRDISERKKAQETLMASQERFKQMVLNSPDTIYLLNTTTNRTEFLNCENFLGYSKLELTSEKSILHTLHPDDRTLVECYWQNLMQGGPDERKPIEYRLKNQSGDWEWVQSRATILGRDIKSKPVEILVTLSIITKRKVAETADQKIEGSDAITHKSKHTSSTHE